MTLLQGIYGIRASKITAGRDKTVLSSKKPWKNGLACLTPMILRVWVRGLLREDYSQHCPPCNERWWMTQHPHQRWDGQGTGWMGGHSLCPMSREHSNAGGVPLHEAPGPGLEGPTLRSMGHLRRPVPQPIHTQLWRSGAKRDKDASGNRCGVCFADAWKGGQTIHTLRHKHI